jgi:3-hydroxyacyl-[acyl-carrier-protein] dehydratase
VTAKLFSVGQFVVPPDHTSLPGHFPGQPIVPGVVLIDNAVALLLAGMPSHRLAGVSCKFIAAVFPGQIVNVAGNEPDDGRCAFLCTVGETVVARGTIRLHPAQTSDGTSTETRVVV